MNVQKLSVNKGDLLKQIKELSAQKLITQDEVIAAYNEGSTAEKTDAALTTHLGITEILYFIGGAIVFLGIAVLLYQNWTTLNTFTKILSTLGSGMAAYFVGLLFSREEKLELVGQAFFFISALVIPIGIGIAFYEAHAEVTSPGTQSLISAILVFFFLGSYFVFRKHIFTIFAILYGTWLFFSFTSYLVGSSNQFDAFKFYQYRFLVAGLAYMLLGYAFSKDERAPISGMLYGLGVIGFLGAAIALGGWSPNQNVFWELIFPGLVFGIIFLSVQLKSKSFLIFGSLYLMAYILKITSEYFTEGLGWPLSLVLAGLMLIGIGYYSVYLNRKYIVVH